ncbi:MAG: helix-turn-helix transcriptional regulator [Alphaproteobacteria bacterium]|nr:helix-turn-helix transcriptional regulator [Alphaproteobacteria bacterium]
MITGRQIRAARGLLDLSQDELAKAANLTKQGISKIEDGSVQPRESTLADIVRVFSERGIEFTENQGVRLKPHSIETLEGRTGFTKFYGLMREHVATHGGDICVSGVDEKLFAKYRDDPEQHRTKMAELLKRQPTLKMRILVAEGDYNFTASSYADYRWQPRDSFSPTAFYVFGDCLALISFTHDPAPLVVLIKSAAFAESYRHAFNLAWASSHEPPPRNIP